MLVPVGGEVGVDKPPVFMGEAVDDLHVALIQREVEEVEISMPEI